MPLHVKSIPDLSKFKVKVMQKNRVLYLHFFELHFFTPEIELYLNYMKFDESFMKMVQTKNHRKESIMKKYRIKSFMLIVMLIAITSGAMAYTSGKGKRLFSKWTSAVPQPVPASSDIVHISGHLIQNKILYGSDGIVNLSLILQAADDIANPTQTDRNVDMVIVLDRSGSMKGNKINDARQSILKLLAKLSDQDRIALITYSEGIQSDSGLLPASRANQQYLMSFISAIQAGGGTDLGSGLQLGINTLLSRNRNGNNGKLILISDGLANRGITSSHELGNMAEVAIEEDFSVSTVGVGLDFNEHLMTTIADKGSGTYYFLENPAAFAEVFEKEFYYSKATIADSLAVKIPLTDGMTLVDAAGYPIQFQNGHAIFHPGNMRAGQTRKLFLTFQLPTHAKRKFEINPIKVSYFHNGRKHETTLADSFKIACIANRKEVVSSIDKKTWTEKVLQEDYNRLKQEIADDLKAGKKNNALDRIEHYYQEKETLNADVGSAAVAENLDKDLNELRSVVEETFQGAPAAVSRKQKSNSKSLQYESYGGRRHKQ
jgi:Ca-activated chloride channel family protein